MEIEIRRVKVRMRTVSGTIYVGRVYVQEKMRLTDVLNDERDFLAMTEVEETDNPRKVPFLAIHKSTIETVTIVPET
jgi:hypothetical protein